MESSSIEVKLMSSGRYTWKIIVNYPQGGDYASAVKEAKEIDKKLKDEFPDFVMKASGRTIELED